MDSQLGSLVDGALKPEGFSRKSGMHTPLYWCRVLDNALLQHIFVESDGLEFWFSLEVTTHVPAWHIRPVITEGFDPPQLALLEKWLYDERIVGRNWQGLTGWGLQQADDAIDSLMRHGLAWFDKNGSLDGVAESLTDELNNGVPIAVPSRAKRSWFLSKPDTEERDYPHGHRLRLAVVFDRRDEKSQAAQYLAEWLDKMGGWKYRPHYEEVAESWRAQASEHSG